MLFSISKLDLKDVTHESFLPNCEYGTIDFEFSFHVDLLDIKKPTEAKIFNGNSTFVRWDSESFETELILGSVNKHIKSPFDECYAFLWRTRAKDPHRGHVFYRAKFTPTTKFTDMNSSGDEGYRSLEWNNKNVKVALGTEDRIYLSWRCEHELMFPMRWKYLFESYQVDHIFSSSNHSIDANFPQLGNEDGILQFQYIWSWSTNTEYVEEDESMIVCETPAALLEALGAENDMKTDE